MPQVRKLTVHEVQELHNKPKGQRRLIEEQYDDILNEYNVGDYGEAHLEEEENRLTVRNRLRAAAQRRGLQIAFRRTSGDLIRFRVVDATAKIDDDAEEELAVASDAPPAKARAGRPKKS